MMPAIPGVIVERRSAGQLGYLLDFAQVLVVACHCPPFFSQSTFVLY